MTRKVVIRVGLVLAVVAAGFGVRQFAFSSPAPSFRFVTVEKGDIQSMVSTTGTLGAVTTVNVGTQVSGQVSALYADFNDQVKKGQLLARIDPTIAQQAVADAQANLERLRAQTNQAARDQDRNRELAAAGLIPASQLEQGEAALKVAQASEKSTLIALSRAQQSLSYTDIHAPIDGVVVERNVNLGQTVAASLSAPQLFLIANDLTQMRILAQVGESDIDKIQQGQKVRFTVQAIPGSGVRRDRAAGPAAVDHGRQRRQLHGRDHAREPEARTPSRHDRAGGLPGEGRDRRAEGQQRGAALQAERRTARPARREPHPRGLSAAPWPPVLRSDAPARARPVARPATEARTAGPPRAPCMSSTPPADSRACEFRPVSPTARSPRSRGGTCPRA